MMNVLARVVRWVKDDHVLFAPDGAGRTFMVCHHCRAVVPAWRILGSPKRPGCTCGSVFVRPATISALSAAWWLFVRGLLLRRLLLRREWDPRISVQ